MDIYLRFIDIHLRFIDIHLRFTNIHPRLMDWLIYILDWWMSILDGWISILCSRPSFLESRISINEKAGSLFRFLQNDGWYFHALLKRKILIPGIDGYLIPNLSNPQEFNNNNNTTKTGFNNRTAVHNNNTEFKSFTSTQASFFVAHSCNFLQWGQDPHENHIFHFYCGVAVDPSVLW